MRLIVVAWLLFLLSLSASTAVAELLPRIATVEHIGELQRLDPGGRTAVVDGIEYRLHHTFELIREDSDGRYQVLNPYSPFGSSKVGVEQDAAGLVRRLHIMSEE